MGLNEHKQDRQVSNVRFTPYNKLNGFGLTCLEKLEQRTAFVSRLWNNQEAIRFVLMVDRINKPIESSIYIHYINQRPVDLAYELSESYGCSVQCAYCASGSLPPPVLPLNPVEIAGQYFLLKRYCEDKKSLKNVKQAINFQGIGEPTLYAKDIILATSFIKEFEPEAVFRMSTMGFVPESISRDFAESPVSWASIQLTLLHWNSNALHSLFRGAPDSYDPTKVLRALKEYSEKRPDTKLKFNYICIQGFNDSVDTLRKTVELITSHGFTFGPRVEMKLSYLNPTLTAGLNSLKSADKAKINELLGYLQRNMHIADSYAFGPMEDINVACGQLVSENKKPKI